MIFVIIVKLKAILYDEVDSNRICVKPRSAVRAQSGSSPGWKIKSFYEAIVSFLECKNVSSILGRSLPTD